MSRDVVPWPSEFKAICKMFFFKQVDRGMNILMDLVIYYETKM